MTLNKTLQSQLKEYIAKTITDTLTKKQHVVTDADIMMRVKDLDLSTLNTLNELIFKLDNDEHILTDDEYPKIVDALQHNKNIAKICYNVASNTDVPYDLAHQTEGDSECNQLLNNIELKLQMIII